MRVAIQISTGKILEMQSNASPGTLVNNAVTAGYSANDVEELEMTPAEYKAAMVLQATPAEKNAPILAELQRIDNKTIRALREGDAARIADYEAQAATLRAQLIQ